MAVDKVGIEFLRCLNLFLENFDVVSHDLVLVGLSRTGWSAESRVGAAKDEACSRGHRPVGHDHDDNFESSLCQEGFKFLLAILQDAFERNLDPIIAQLGQCWNGGIKSPVRRLFKRDMKKGNGICMIGLPWPFGHQNHPQVPKLT